ncbi:MAG: hypothetical protein ACSHXY_01165 [Alphaproteobacteria bacterium]
MVIQAFADESEDQSFFNMSAVVSSASNWELFSEEWTACLIKPPWLPYFKMKDAAGKNGTFHKFTFKQRDARLRDFADIINRYVKVVTHSVIDMEAHSRTWRQLDKPRNQSYFWPYQNTINAICFELHDRGLREPFEMIFDEHVIFGPRAKQWYPIMRAIMKHREPSVYDMMPAEPIFGSDEKLLPIQAADFFAWLQRNEVKNPDDRRFEWIFDLVKNVSGSTYSQNYDEERMRAVLNEAKAIAKNNGVPDAIEEEYKRIFD